MKIENESYHDYDYTLDDALLEIRNWSILMCGLFDDISPELLDKIAKIAEAAETARQQNILDERRKKLKVC